MFCADGNLYIVVGKRSASPLTFKNSVCFCVGRVHVQHFHQLCSICRYFHPAGSLKAEPFFEDRLTN